MAASAASSSATPEADVFVVGLRGPAGLRDLLDSLLEPEVGGGRFVLHEGYDQDLIDTLRRRGFERLAARPSRSLGGMEGILAQSLEQGLAPWIALVHARTWLPKGWLARMLGAAESAGVEAAAALSNAAGPLSLRPAPGANALGLDRQLVRFEPERPRLRRPSGPLLLLRRRALADQAVRPAEAVPPRLSVSLAPGTRAVLVDDVYVMVPSATGQSGVEEAPEAAADERVEQLRRHFGAVLRSRPGGALRETAREARARWRSSGALASARTLATGLAAAPRARADAPSPERVEHSLGPGLRVTYLLDTFALNGGVWSVVQLANELVRQGAEARIAAVRANPEAQAWPLRSAPLLYRSAAELVRRLPETDVVVATAWRTAPWARQLLARGRARRGVYFVQDYEAWFHRGARAGLRERIVDTYRMLPDCIVKSDWLRDMLSRHGVEAEKIGLGLDLETFRPCALSPPKHPTVVAMARPGTPWRGFERLVEVLARVRRERPRLEVVFFGEALDARRIPFPFRGEGVLADRAQVARLLSEAHVFLDASDFQGFGRVGLEAMACGTACVLSDAGGVGEYARHDENAWLAPPGDVDGLVRGVNVLLDDEAMRQRFLEGGRATAARHDHRQEAELTLDYLSRRNRNDPERRGPV